MSSFAFLGGQRTGQYLVRPPFASHLLHMELIRLLIVACGMMAHSSSMAVLSCWILAGTGTRCHIRIVYVSYPKHAQWVTCPVRCWPCKNWDVFSCQELCSDPCNMGPYIFMLQHEVMVVDEWHNNEPQDFFTVSLCIQNAINKMHLHNIHLPIP